MESILRVTVHFDLRTLVRNRSVFAGGSEPSLRDLVEKVAPELRSKLKKIVGKRQSIPITFKVEKEPQDCPDMWVVIQTHHTHQWGVSAEQQEQTRMSIIDTLFAALGEHKAVKTIGVTVEFVQGGTTVANRTNKK